MCLYSYVYSVDVHELVVLENFHHVHVVAHGPNSMHGIKDFDPVLGHEWPDGVVEGLKSKLRGQFPGGLKIAVFLPSLTTLKTQTMNRLEKNHRDLGDWGCTGGRHPGDSDFFDTVMFYSTKGESGGSYTALLKQIREKDDTLFLLIADECHRGVSTKSGDPDDAVSDDTGAHHILLNNHDISTRRNVIIADVSATP